MLLLFLISAVFFMPSALGQSSSSLGVVVEARNITLPAGTQAVLPCNSPRMVWTRDRLKDRQRVVHWDLVRSIPEYSVERILDMSPGVKERVYNGFNKGRITIPKTAFTDGNFSLVINNVGAADRGVYSCNLHHHYCQLHQSIKIQLNTTKSARKEKRYWDGDKTVFVVLLGSSVVLPCVNRRPLWTEGLQEDQQQVAHWDWQPPGVRPDLADRLVDLYASGERRQYGPLFPVDKMSVSEDAFSVGDFSLTIANLQPIDKGLYSCHLHHHYCGLHERRIFRLMVGPPLPPPPPVLTAAPAAPAVPHALPNDDPRLEYDLRRSKRRGHVTGHEDIALDATELKVCNQEHLNSDYKNNLLKERDLSKDCNKEMDGKLWK
ncbi:matrix remodeling-associated protein 8 isoform X2 [Coregonus clupeaformis]|uniref:matrix remodeling-associated protein 8 isoform X2 n=1 Tax=Coregonus clupeaformis TaxID=59861 RepID=UPI001BDFE9FF|nr:matrix remodeling-associated protein 8 isoform X2 [Coregonus clupeaformis]